MGFMESMPDLGESRKSGVRFVGAGVVASIAALIAAAFYFIFRRGGRPSRSVLLLLIVSVAITLGAYVLPSLEGELLRMLNFR